MSIEVLLIPGDGSLSKEEDRILVSRDVANMSLLLKEMLEGGNDEEAEEQQPEVPLPNVRRAQLLLVREFCNHHVTNPMQEFATPLRTRDLRELVGDWDTDFINRVPGGTQGLLDLVLAANYLDIPSLLKLGCAKLTTMIMGKSLEEIRTEFGIDPALLTAEQEEKIRKENEWIFDVN